MLFLILSLLVQAAFIVHVIKTGRNQLWIWVLIIPGLALAGIPAYLVVEILPVLFRSRAAQRAGRGLRKAIDPERDLRRYESEVRVADNVASRQRYAEELVRRERYDEAIAQYREALTGLYEHDPNLMLGLAQAQFGKGEASAARYARRAHPSQPRFPLPDRASALCARARGRRQRPEGARGIRGARALLPGRRGLGTLRAAPQGAGAGGRGAESGTRAPRAGAHRARSLPPGAAILAGRRSAAVVGPRYRAGQAAECEGEEAQHIECAAPTAAAAPARR